MRKLRIKLRQMKTTELGNVPEVIHLHKIKAPPQYPCPNPMPVRLHGKGELRLLVESKFLISWL